MLLPEQLTGYGITLHRWRPSDAERLHQAVMESLDHLRPWMAWVSQEPITVEQRRAMLQGWEADWLAGGGTNYAVLLDTETVAGGCGLHNRLGPGALEISYWTHPAFLGRGVASTAAQLLTEAAFAVPGIQRVEIHHDRANLRSRGVPERLGFEFAGESPNRCAAPAEVGIDCVWKLERSAWTPPPRG